MDKVNTLHTEPMIVPRTRRNHDITVVTSLPAGKVVPVAAVPLLREDGMLGRVSIAVEMMETVELLMNPVFLRATAFFVPHLAFERFEGSRDQFDRSYKGEPKIVGGAVVPFIETAAMGAHGSNAVYKSLGLHAKSTDLVNTGYLEAYNAIVNFRRTQRSRNLSQRTRLQTDLAEAFWVNSRFEHIVPSFDEAMIDGAVPLSIIDNLLPVKGMGFVTPTGYTTFAAGVVKETGGTSPAYPEAYYVEGSGGTTASGETFMAVKRLAGQAVPEIYAEMSAGGLQLSLATIEQAKKTRAFAEWRRHYEGYDVDDEYLVDMLMDGLTIPDQHLKQPILIADQRVRFSQAKRYATDAGNLAESAVSGAAVVNLSLRVPRVSTGGVVMVMLEAMPEQLFERQRDPYFHSSDVALWPEFVRDSLDTQKVEIIKNGQVDTDHATPDATFGFGPLHWQWTSFGPRAGNKFYRPTVNTSTDQERQRLWAVENVNPVLGEDFYLVNDIHVKPFLDLEADPFEATVVGGAVIEGNTVFGGKLVESAGNYDKVLEKAPTTQIEQ